MTGENTITTLLGIFQECKKRGEKASLFLETKNGEEFATFRVNLSASHTVRTPEKPSFGTTAKRKSPSTLKRDRKRLENYRTKSLEKSCDPVKTSTSTPVMKFQQNLETSAVAMDFGTPILDSRAEENDKTTNDDNAKQDDENEKNSSEVNWEEIDKIIEKSIAKYNTPLRQMMNDTIEIMNSMKEKDEENEDNFEDAKKWAMKQKLSLM